MPLRNEVLEVIMRYSLAERIRDDERAVKTLLVGSVLRSGVVLAYLLLALVVAGIKILK